MKTTTLSRIVPVTILAAAVLTILFSPGLAPDASAEILPAIPVIAIRATVPETREPFCDPAICDAALPAPGVFVVSRRGGDLARELWVFLTYEGTAASGTDYPALPNSVFFGANVESVQLLVEAAYDKRPEGDETVVARLQPDPSLGPIERYRLDATQSVAQVVIHDGITTASLELTAPKEGAEFSAGESIRIAATAIDLDGAITHVDFFDADKKIGESSIFFFRQPDPGTPIYHEFVWTGASAGAHEITARALNAAGNAVTSPPVHLKVGTGLPIVSLEATSPIAEESSFPFRRLALRGRFTITRTGPTDTPLPVFVLYSGTATPDLDYPALPWFVSIPAGTNRVELEVVPKPDNLAEPIEIIEAELSQCPPLTDPPLGIPCYNVNIDPARSTARVFIRDDGITTASLELTAPKEGAEFGAGESIRIAATAIDLDGAITHVDFFDADKKIGESSIVFFRQPDPGTPIYHEFVWTGASAGAHEITARALNAAGNAVTSPPVHLKVGTGLPIVSLESTVPETTEPSPTTRVRPGAFTLRRTGDASNLLRVWIRYGGTAMPGIDYVTPPTVVEFPAGAASVEVLIAPLEDERLEGDETVVAQLYLPPIIALIFPRPMDPYRIDPAKSKALVLIHDSPLTPPRTTVVSIIAVDAFAREGTNGSGEVNTATFVVTRSGTTNDPLAVRFALGGTASNGIDYAALASPLVIPAGERRARLPIKPVDDLRVEPIETVVVTLLPDDSAPADYTLGFPRRAAAVILDNDRPRTLSQRLPDGLFSLSVPMGNSDCFRVEVTSDFKEWTPLCTVPLTEGRAHFVDPDAPEIPLRFYRFVPVPCEP